MFDHAFYPLDFIASKELTLPPLVDNSMPGQSPFDAIRFAPPVKTLQVPDFAHRNRLAR